MSMKGTAITPRIKRDKTMADKLRYIPNDDTENYPFCRLQLVVETFEHSTKIKNNQNSIICLSLVS